MGKYVVSKRNPSLRHCEQRALSRERSVAESSPKFLDCRTRMRSLAMTE
jgi:hypothetical protein